jgi:hypothetical protein
VKPYIEANFKGCSNGISKNNGCELSMLASLGDYNSKDFNYCISGNTTDKGCKQIKIHSRIDNIAKEFSNCLSGNILNNTSCKLIQEANFVNNIGNAYSSCSTGKKLNTNCLSESISTVTGYKLSSLDQYKVSCPTGYNLHNGVLCYRPCADGYNFDGVATCTIDKEPYIKAGCNTCAKQCSGLSNITCTPNVSCTGMNSCAKKVWGVCVPGGATRTIDCTACDSGYSYDRDGKCKYNKYTNGLGYLADVRTPNICPSNTDLVGLACFTKCPTGYTRDSTNSFLCKKN